MAQGRTHPILTATRLTKGQRATVDFAAQLAGVSVTELLREAALQLAREHVERHVYAGTEAVRTPIVGAGAA